MTEAQKETILDTRFAKAYFLREEKTIVCSATTNYIPEKEFKEIFITMGEWIKKHKTEKLIFDKSSLTVFHQPSMEWYHVEWKMEMARFGLRTYRKVLPTDEFFKKSVQIGRDKISRENSNFKFEDFDIQYCDSLQEALTK